MFVQWKDFYFPLQSLPLSTPKPSTFQSIRLRQRARNRLAATSPYRNTDYSPLLLPTLLSTHPPTRWNTTEASGTTSETLRPDTRATTRPSNGGRGVATLAGYPEKRQETGHHAGFPGTLTTAD